VGDTGGVVVFLATIVVLGLLWRIDFIINDSVTVGNLLVNVAEGHLAVTDAPYALTAGEQPGLVEVDGQLYGRNYGQVYLAVPILWALDLLAGLVDLRLLIAAGWSMAVLGLGHALARWLDRPTFAAVGTALALLSFVGSMAIATEIGWLARPRPVVALGLSTMLLAGTGATVLYRLLALVHDRRVGMAGGLALVLATPIGFWGSFPKRHVLSATVLLLVCYCFAVSRGRADRVGTLARAGAYAILGYFASVHAFEAAFAVAVLFPIDLLTAPSNDRRTLLVVALVFAVSLVPMFATNAAISGDPLQPPRTIEGVEGGLSLDPADVPVDGGGSTGGGGSGGGGGDGGGSGSSGGGAGSGGAGGGLPFIDLLAPLVPFVDKLRWIGSYMLGALTAGFAASLEAERLLHVFVRSGWIPGVQYHLTGFETLELAFLEVFPLAGVILAAPVIAARRVRALGRDSIGRLREALADPVHQTDVFVGALACTLFVVYLPRIPLYAMLTLRYVVPVMPLVLYAVLRLPPVRTAIADESRSVALAYTATLAVAAAAVLTTVVLLDPAKGEAIQLHGILGLVASMVAAVVVATWPIHGRRRAVAGALGLTAAVTTLYYCAAALLYFESGNHALDLVRLVAEILPAVG
jgi:uncharacterized membrane protein YgcG